MTDQDILVKLKDPKYLIERAFSIVNRDGERVPFIFNPVQADYHQKRTPLDLVTKARRMGFSAMIDAIFLADCITIPNTHAVLVAHEDEATERLFRRVEDFIKHSALKIRTRKASAREYIFDDTDSWFWIGTAGSREFGRSDEITRAHLSERAFYPNQKVVTSVQEALSRSGYWMVEETTANGAGTAHHEEVLRAERGDSNWKHHFYGWWQDPLNVVAGGPVPLDPEEKRLKEAFNLTWPQIAWRRKKLRDMQQPELFAQEHPATWEEAFLASGAMLFDWLAIKRQEAAALPVKWRGHIVDRGSEIAVEPDTKGPLTIWRNSDDRARYLMISDAAEGIVGQAYSVTDVYDMRIWEQVAQWRGHADPQAFADISMRMGALYNWALWAPENNYPGNACIQRAMDHGYPNIWADPDNPKSSTDATESLGFKTTEKTKGKYISDGRAAVKDGSLKINSSATLNEYRTFVLLENGKAGPQPGCWQDTVITSCKAANILKHFQLEPEEKRTVFRDVMKMGRRRGGARGGRFRAGVV